MFKPFTFAVVGLAVAMTNMSAAEKTKAPSVDDVARAFRVEIYDSFRANREEYDARRSAADELMQAWQDAGEPADYEAVVLEWFQLASAGALPPLPQLPTPADSKRDQDTSVKFNVSDQFASPGKKSRGVFNSMGRALFGGSKSEPKPTQPDQEVPTTTNDQDPFGDINQLNDTLPSDQGKISN